jgi:uncharacterized protein involved in outer membrane biogenesis
MTDSHRWFLSRRRWTVLAIAAAVVLLAIVLMIASIVPFSPDVARRRLIAVLSDRLESDVQLESLQLRVFPSLRAEGTGLAIKRRETATRAPVISVRRFVVHCSLSALLRRHVSKITLEGLAIEIPPKTAADQGRPPSSSSSSANRSKLPRSLVLDELETTDATLTIVPRNPNKRPKVWSIHALHMQSVAFDTPMPFQATLTNAIPPGEIQTRGSFGPWNADDPGATPLGGEFTFDKADLGVFKGIAGILSSRGTFGGTLERLNVQGDTETPDFTVAAGGHPVPLETKYHAVVDGTNGDTILQQVDASFLSSSLTASGGIIDAPGPDGRTVRLDVKMDSARLEDVLRLAVKSPRPPMAGGLRLTTTFVLPPGKIDVVKKLQLDGRFSISRALFTDPEVQTKITELSMRSRGKRPVATSRRSVPSDFEGTFRLARGVLAIPSVAFDVPGAIVRLSGTYNLVTEQLDFTGTLVMQANISETVTGIKSVLLKAVNPLFRHKGGGSEIPIRIGGTVGSPSFGLDTKRVFSRK